MLDLKETTVAIFEEGKFELHKWHSNESVLEAKSLMMGSKVTRRISSELLGLPWNKNNDTTSVTFPQQLPKRPREKCYDS